MSPSGFDKIHLTNSNNAGHPVTKDPVFCADFDWRPDADRIVAYIQQNLITQDGMLVMIELADETVRTIKFGR